MHADWFKIMFLLNNQIMNSRFLLRGSSRQHSPSSYNAQKSKVNNLIIRLFTYSLLFQYKSTSCPKLYLNPLHSTDTLKTLRSGCHFVNKGTLLRYSLSITEQIVSSIANQRGAFAIEHQQIIINIPKLNRNTMHVFYFLIK